MSICMHKGIHTRAQHTHKQTQGIHTSVQHTHKQTQTPFSPEMQPGGRITSVAAVEDDASVASASVNGSIHVWRVDVARRRTTGSAGGAGAGPEKYHGGCKRMGVPCRACVIV